MTPLLVGIWYVIFYALQSVTSTYDAGNINPPPKPCQEKIHAGAVFLLNNYNFFLSKPSVSLGDNKELTVYERCRSPQSCEPLSI
jgi:hypothetical protein